MSWIKLKISEKRRSDLPQGMKNSFWLCVLYILYSYWQFCCQDKYIQRHYFDLFSFKEAFMFCFEILFFCFFDTLHLKASSQPSSIFVFWKNTLYLVFHFFLSLLFLTYLLDLKCNKCQNAVSAVLLIGQIVIPLIIHLRVIYSVG